MGIAPLSQNSEQKKAKIRSVFRSENRPKTGQEANDTNPTKEWCMVYWCIYFLPHRERICNSCERGMSLSGSQGAIWFRHCPASIAVLSLSFKPLEDTNSHGSDLRVTCCSELLVHRLYSISRTHVLWTVAIVMSSDHMLPQNQIKQDFFHWSRLPSFFFDFLIRFHFCYHVNSSGCGLSPRFQIRVQAGVRHRPILVFWSF